MHCVGVDIFRLICNDALEGFGICSTCSRPMTNFVTVQLQAQWPIVFPNSLIASTPSHLLSYDLEPIVPRHLLMSMIINPTRMFQIVQLDYSLVYTDSTDCQLNFKMEAVCFQRVASLDKVICSRHLLLPPFVNFLPASLDKVLIPDMCFFHH